MLAGDSGGDKIYMDFSNIQKNNGYVYYWTLVDNLKPYSGDYSTKGFYEVNCNIPIKSRAITHIYYKLPMGQGYSRTDNTTYKWHYASPESIGANILRMVCGYADMML